MPCPFAMKPYSYTWCPTVSGSLGECGSIADLNNSMSSTPHTVVAMLRRAATGSGCIVNTGCRTKRIASPADSIIAPCTAVFQCVVMPRAQAYEVPSPLSVIVAMLLPGGRSFQRTCMYRRPRNGIFLLIMPPPLG